MRETELLQKKNNQRYLERSFMKLLAAILCILVFIGCWTMIVPEIYRLTSDMNTAYTITILIGLFVCHMIFTMCEK